MSEADLEAVRSSYEDFNRGDLEAWLGWFSPDATWQAAREDPDAALHSGIDEIRRYVEGWIEAYGICAVSRGRSSRASAATSSGCVSPAPAGRAASRSTWSRRR